MFFSEITGKSYKTIRGRINAENRFGYTHSEETKRKMRITRGGEADPKPKVKKPVGRPRGSKSKTGRDGRPAGYVPTAEHRERLRLLHLGKTRSDETKEKMREAKLGVPKSAIHVVHMVDSQNRRWAAVRGEEWAVRWYIENGKEVPCHRDNVKKETAYLDDMRREIAIEKIKTELGLN